MFHPFGYNVGLSETILVSKALGWPVLLLGGDALAFNILVLASFVLSGFTMYLLVLRLTRNPWAALLSGTTYAFAPYRIYALAAGWIPLLPTQWLPLALLYLDKALDGRRSQPAVLAGLFATLSALSSWYYAYVLVIILPIYAFVRARPWRFTLTDRRLWKAVAAFVTVVATLTVPVAIPAAGLGSSSLSWLLGDADRGLASLDDFFLSNIYHPLWGNSSFACAARCPNIPGTRRASSTWECYRYCWAIIALAPRLRGRDATLCPSPQLALFLSGLVSAILALGTTLHVAGQRVYLPVPPAVEEGFSRLMIITIQQAGVAHGRLFQPAQQRRYSAAAARFPGVFVSATVQCHAPLVPFRHHHHTGSGSSGRTRRGDGAETMEQCQQAGYGSRGADRPRSIGLRGSIAALRSIVYIHHTAGGSLADPATW
jgi:hypothetical protein